MSFTKIRLHFTSPLHIAARGVGFERVSWIVHSDTLYSAILTVWSHINRDEAQAIASAESPPFLLSSAFPFHDAHEFYPKPLAPVKVQVEPQDGKHFAKVQYIAAPLFKQIIAGQAPRFSPEATLQSGRFWTHAIPEPASDQAQQQTAANRSAPIIHEIEVPRVVIDRVTNQGMLYHVSELHFAEKAGLYFWLKCEDQERQARLLQVLRLLGDEGLGLDRTSGKGLFKVEAVAGAPPGLTNASRFLTLSLYHPPKHEVDAGLLHQCGYELMRRGGFIFGMSYRRQSLNLFAEGSVFTGNPAATYGDKNEVLAPGFAASAVRHPVYRYGYAFPIGFYQEAAT